MWSRKSLLALALTIIATFAAGMAIASWQLTTTPVTVTGVGLQVIPFGPTYRLILPVQFPDGSVATFAITANRLD